MGTKGGNCSSIFFVDFSVILNKILTLHEKYRIIRIEIKL